MIDKRQKTTYEVPSVTFTEEMISAINEFTERDFSSDPYQFFFEPSIERDVFLEKYCTKKIVRATSQYVVVEYVLK